MPKQFARRPKRVLVAALASSSALLALLAPAPAGAAVTTTKTAAGTATIPVPASAKVQPGAAGGAAAPTTTAPATTTPTTTYVPPAGATPLPGAAATGTQANQLRSATGGSPPARAHRGSGLSTAAIALAALAGLLALACAAWGIARLLAYEPHWVRSARHALAEAGFRTSSTWAEFTDWIRLGH